MNEEHIGFSPEFALAQFNEAHLNGKPFFFFLFFFLPSQMFHSRSLSVSPRMGVRCRLLGFPAFAWGTSGVWFLHFVCWLAIHLDSPCLLWNQKDTDREKFTKSPCENTCRGIFALLCICSLSWHALGVRVFDTVWLTVCFPKLHKEVN